MTKWQRNDEAQAKARHTRFMRGWDDAIMGFHLNPYSREDYRSDYDRGHRACLLGNPLPAWYDDWRAAR